jgi:Rieske Fe-S protein
MGTWQTHGMASQDEADQVGRRTVLALGGGAAAAVVLAACSSGGETSAVATPGEANQSGSTGQTGQTLTSVDQVPLGGGVVLPDPAIVVTQPETGVYKAFTAICPHQGCLVDEVVDNEIVCPCHGSRFSAADGAVLVGPATEGLASEPITVQGTQISLS